MSDLEHLKNKFKDQIFSKIPLPDTVEYACKELKTQTIIEITASGVVHEFNFDTKKTTR